MGQVHTRPSQRRAYFDAAYCADGAEFPRLRVNTGNGNHPIWTRRSELLRALASMRRSGVFDLRLRGPSQGFIDRISDWTRIEMIVQTGLIKSEMTRTYTRRHLAALPQ